MAYHRINDLDFLTDAEYDDLADVFATRYIKGEPDDCWPWMGGTGDHGRGSLTLNRQSVPAPRISYLLYVGDIPDHDSHHGICVLHKCDNPPCVNPRHLFLGTQGDNMRDRDRKGRGPHGRPSRLTDDAVRAIRRDERRSRDIAAEYQISVSMVCNIKAYRCWNHIPPDPADVPVMLQRNRARMAAEVAQFT